MSKATYSRVLLQSKEREVGLPIVLLHVQPDQYMLDLLAEDVKVIGHEIKM
jgi:hypothetical protein